MTLDVARILKPTWGWAAYAYDPGGPVTVEAHPPTGDVFTSTAPTVGQALRRFFPEPGADIFG